MDHSGISSFVKKSHMSYVTKKMNE